MVKRLSVLVLVSVTMLPTTMASPGIALANTPPGECREEDLSEQTNKAGWVTVHYDAPNLVDPTRANYLQEAETIAVAIRDEANEALARYRDLGLGAWIHQDIHIELLCKLVVVPVLAEPPAYTPGPALIQIRVGDIRADLADVVMGGPQHGVALTDDAWRTPKYWWVETVHHEAFHALQWSMVGSVPTFVSEYLAGTSLYESGATLAQDLFGADDDDPTVVGDDLRQDIAGSYWDSVQDHFDAEIKPSISESALFTPPAYDVAAIFQYWAEQFGRVDVADLEQRAALFLEEMTRADGTSLEAMQQALGRDVFDALRDFYITAYARQRGPQSDLRYRILDESLNTDGFAADLTYGDLAVAPNDRQPLNSAVFENHVLRHAAGRVYEVTLPAGTEIVRVDVEKIPMWFLGEAPIEVSAIPVDTDAGEVAHVARRNRWQASDQPQLIPVAGYEKLALVLVSGNATQRYNLTVEDAGDLPAIEILAPSIETPIAIGPAADLRQFEVKVAGVNGAALPPGLGPESFEVTVGTQAAESVEPVALPDGTYELVVQAQGLADGLHDLTVALGTSSPTEYDAIIVGEAPAAAVAIVIDNSGSMGSAKMTAAKDAAVSFVREMEIGDQVAVVSFNTSATTRKALTTIVDEATRESVITAINGISSTGGTNIGSGIDKGNAELAAATAGYARAQVLLSDGYDQYPTSTDAAVANTPPDIEIHTIALTADSDQALLQSIAERTDGRFLFAPTGDELEELYLLIRAEVGGVETVASGSLGELAQGETETTSFVVGPQTGAMAASLRWLGSDFDLTLVSPSGRVIDEATTESDVEMDHGADFVTLTVQTPEAGEWQLTATGVDVPSAQEVTYRVEESSSPLRSKLYMTTAGGAGTGVGLRLLLTENGRGVTDASVTASVDDPAGTERVFVLTDDGGNMDGRADDGMYGVSAYGTDLSGSYTITVSASGMTSSGEPFTRLEVASTFLGAKVDSDGDGIADVTEEAFGLNPADATDGAVDHDSDGLTTADEFALGTDPFAEDTDKGGEQDGSEVTAGRDPLFADDDAAPPVPVLDVRSKDGNLVEIAVGTRDGSGSVELFRLTPEARTSLGSHAGSGVTLDDGPLGAGEYWYEAIAVSADGARSSPLVRGPASPAADVSPPSALMSVNGGTWSSSTPTVPIEFFDVSEPVAEMRFGLSEEDLLAAGWQPYATPTSLTVGSESGTYTVYGQLRDVAGNVSSPMTGTVAYTAESVITLTAIAWGSAGSGQLGQVVTEECYVTGPCSTVPLEVDIPADVIGLAGGYSHSLALTADGSVWSWGGNQFGQLGDGGNTVRPTPQEVLSLTDVVAIAAGNDHSLAVKTDGTVWAWGRNNSGQLGDGTQSDRKSPVMVSNLSGVTAVAAGSAHSLAVKSDGSVWAWGYNADGQLGDGSAKSKLQPVQADIGNVTAVSAGGSKSLALKGDGSVWEWPQGNRKRPTQVSSLTSVTAIDAGGGHQLALRSDGTLWSWGTNFTGELGDGTRTSRSEPVQVEGLQGVVEVSAGENHSLAVLADGSMWGWGQNDWAQITTSCCYGYGQPTPMPIAWPDTATAIEAGYHHSLAISH